MFSYIWTTWFTAQLLFLPPKLTRSFTCHHSEYDLMKWEVSHVMLHKHRTYIHKHAHAHCGRLFSNVALSGQQEQSCSIQPTEWLPEVILCNYFNLFQKHTVNGRLVKGKLVLTSSPICIKIAETVDVLSFFKSNEKNMTKLEQPSVECIPPPRLKYLICTYSYIPAT